MSNLDNLSRLELLKKRQDNEFRRATLEGRALHWRRLVIAANELAQDYAQIDAKTGAYMRDLCVRGAGMEKEALGELKSIKAEIQTINALLAPANLVQNWRDARDEFQSLYGISDESEKI